MSGATSVPNPRLTSEEPTRESRRATRFRANKLRRRGQKNLVLVGPGSNDGSVVMNKPRGCLGK